MGTVMKRYEIKFINENAQPKKVMIEIDTHKELLRWIDLLKKMKAAEKITYKEKPDLI
tara:strand:+ start:118 stop:291 length:174 start_codon:yes stop_codon:yes gene_type:complete